MRSLEWRNFGAERIGHQILNTTAFGTKSPDWRTRTSIDRERWFLMFFMALWLVTVISWQPLQPHFSKI